MSTCSHKRRSLSRSCSRICSCIWEDVPFQVLLPSEEVPIPGTAPMGRGYVQVMFPWEEVTSRSCSHGRGPVLGPAPMGGCYVQVMFPFKEFPFQVQLPREKVTSRSRSHGKKSRPGQVPMGGGPVPGPAPDGGGPIQGSALMGRGYVQVHFPCEEVKSRSCSHRRRSPFQVPAPKKTSGTRVNHFFLFFGCVGKSVYD
jgi:hypothetical protein